MPFGLKRKGHQKKDKLQTFQNEVLAVHNDLRSNHAAPPLRWSDKCARSAQTLANELAKLGRLQHKVEAGMGQNLAYVWSSNGKDVTGGQIVSMWYDEIKDYDFKKATFVPNTGHFTQVVWVGTQEVGVGISSTPEGKVFVVANYLPAGNMMGEFAENVKPAQKPTGGRSATKGTKGKAKKSKSTVRCVANADLTEFQSDILIVQNELRERHKSPPLQWSASCAASAQQWADQLARMGKLQHKTDGDIGQNLAYVKSSGESKVKGQEIANMWYSEEKAYKYAKAEFQPSTGHFTQLVWAATKAVGVGIASTADGRTYIVANYSPAGNVQGQYGNNVHKPKGSGKLKKLFGRKKGADVTSIGQDGSENKKSKKKALGKTKGAKLGNFKDVSLEAHNQYRAKHGAPPLKWSNDCTAKAKKWAAYLAKHKKFEHSHNKGYGENLACFMSSSSQEIGGNQAVDMWYDEIKDYNFSRATFASGTGHFTQVVWRETKEVGVAMAKGKNNYTVVVANYKPAGNMMGKFKENVLPPSSHS